MVNTWTQLSDGSGQSWTEQVSDPAESNVSLAANVGAFLADPTSAKLAAAVTDETGSGPLVFANGATLTTPNLGTPSAITLTNATGLPISTGLSGLAAGIAAFLATPSSANLRTAVTDETGTGSLVFATSPTLVTPALGTPSSGVLTNATGLPVATGISGLGTGVATFLATPTSANLIAAVTDETGTGSLVFATSPTLVTPALGTPSSGVLTNATGLPISTGVSGLGTGVATFLATPSSTNLRSAVTDETGSGALVFGTSPTIAAPTFSGTIAGSPTVSGTWTFSSPVVVATPVAATDAATKAYVDAFASGTSVKTAVATATTANITLSGEQTIDGILTSASRVLVKDQTTASQNGIYVSAAGAWARATDMDVWTETLGALVPITAGTVNGNSIYASTSTTGGTIGSTDLTFTRFITTSGLQPLDSDLTSWAAITRASGFDTFVATPSSANLASLLTDETGTGSVVFSNSPTLVTPALGTPSAAVLTNATGLPISTGVSGLAAGVATFLATPSSANLRTAVTDETGSGALVFATSPTLVTPALGTPSSGTLTSCTGLPISTGVSGLAAGVATFLATPSSANLRTAVTDETGSGALVFATSPTLVTPALGTPSAAVLTNATGLPISTGVSGLAVGIATFLATPTSANLIAAVTDETGSGALVFATSPTLVTPALGTPTSGVMSATTALATGASTARTMASRFVDLMNVRDFGGSVDGSTADTSAWSSYISAQGTGVLNAPEGTSSTGQITLSSNQTLRGLGPDISFISLRNTINADAILGSGSAALWGTNTDAGVENVSIEGVTIDGNRANNTSGSGIAIYGQRLRLKDVYVRNANDYGIRTEWYAFGSDEFGMEGRFDNVRIDTTGQHGWLFKGPHDSIVTHATIVNSGQDADNTYDGFRIEDYGASQFAHIHAWNDASTGVRNRHAIYTSAYGGTFIDAHGEGAKTSQFKVEGQYTQAIGGRFYASFAGAANVIVNQPAQIWGAYLGGKASGEADAIGLRLGDNTASENVTIISAHAYVGGASHAVDFTWDDGKNDVRLFGIIDMPTTGPNANQPWIGTPNTTDYVDINVWDGTGTQHILRQLPGDTTFGDAITTGGQVIVGTTIELGHATANTLSASSGVLSIEGHPVATTDQGQSISGVYSFTANPAIVSAAPALVINETDGPADEKIWYLAASGGDLYLQSDTDLGGAAVNALRVQRTGTTITNVDVLATSLTLNSVAVPTISSTSTLTNKTLTSPTINGATLSGTLAGSPTFSGSLTLNSTYPNISWIDSNSTSGSRSASIFLNSDFFVLSKNDDAGTYVSDIIKVTMSSSVVDFAVQPSVLSAPIITTTSTSTLTNKTLTSPTINAATLSGTVTASGTVTLSGAYSFKSTDSIVVSEGTAGYGSFLARGSGTNPAYMFFSNVTNAERARVWSDNSRNLSFSTDSGVTSHFAISSSGALTASGVAIPTISSTSTLTNKTLTSPTINGGALSGSFSGTPTFTGATTFSSTGTGNLVSILSTDAGAIQHGLEFYRDSASPAVSDVVGIIAFNGRDSANVKTTYSSLRTQINDPTDATEDGTFIVSVMTAGAPVDAVIVTGGGTTIAGSVAATSGTIGGSAIVTLAATQTLTNKTLTAPIISTISNTGTLTLPTSTDTLVGRATTDTLTNKTIGAFTLSGAVTPSATETHTIGATGNTILQLWSRTVIAQGAAPNVAFRETGVTADSGNWQFQADSEEFYLALANDAGSAISNALRIQRSTTTPTLITFGCPTRIVPKTVASLGSAAGLGAGAKDFVSDANATTFASVVAGGGANNVPVYSDGTNWRIG